MRRANRFLFLLLIMSGALHGATPAPVRATLCDRTRPPVVDGRLDDPIWSVGEWQTGLVLLTDNDVQATPTTTFKFTSTDTALFVAVQLAEPATRQLQATRSAGGALWKDDSIEIFLDPRPADQAYFQIIANSAGQWTALKCMTADGPRLGTWKPDLAVQARVTEDAWQLELSVPFTALESLAPDDTWRFNLVRNRTVDGRIHTFAHTRGGNHRPDRFVPLRLQLPKIVRHRWHLGSPIGVTVEDTAAGLHLSTDVLIHNLTGLFRFYTLHGRLVSNGNVLGTGTAHGGLDTELSRAVRLTVPVSGTGRGMLELRLVDRAEPDVLYQTALFPIPVSYTPLSVTVLRPAYRNSIYTSYPLESILVRVEHRPGATIGKCARATVQIRDATGSVLDSVVRSDPPAAFEAELLSGRVDELPPGAYSVVAEMVANRTHTASSPLTVHERSEQEVLVDQDGALRVNGIPFMPVGWFTPYPKDYDEYASEGYNFLTDYGAPWRAVKTELTFLDQAIGRQLTTMIYPYRKAEGEAPAWYSDINLEHLARRVVGLREHRGLLTWYLADEPAPRPDVVDRLRRIYDTLVSADPYHPCVMLTDTRDKAEAHAANGDVLIVDPYPGFVRGGGAEGPLDRVYRDVRAWQNLAGQKPVWVTPQGHDLAVYGRTGHRAPTFTEVRNMAFQAACAGAKGWLWFRWVFGHNWPGVKIGTSYVARELLGLQPFLLAPESPVHANVKAETPDGIYWTLRQAGGRTLLIVVNTRYEKANVSFAGLPIERPPRVVSETRLAEYKDGQLIAELPPVGVQIYTDADPFPGERTTSEIRAEIAAAVAARGTPGNLAWVGHGVEAVGSGSSVYYAIDGRTGPGYSFDTRSDTPPHWIEIQFPDTVSVSRAIVHAEKLRGRLQAEEGGRWRDLATLHVDSGSIEVRFDPVRTTRLRLTADEQKLLAEIEVYGPAGEDR